jgi:hypothetical protein
MAETNIDAASESAWAENVGWMNWHDAGDPAGSQGVHVGSRFLAGMIWSENVGWIVVGDGSPLDGVAYANGDSSDFGVNIATEGLLSGMAWGENIGWINFDGGATATPAQPARIDCNGRLNGYAWAENAGWIDLSETETGKFVALDSAATPYACDMNHDGAANGRDVQNFVDLLLVGGADWRDLCSGDMEATPDNALNIDDVDAFVSCLMGG